MRKVCKYCGVEFDGDPGASACPDCAVQVHKQVIRQRTCRTCGVAFPGGPRAWYCPACREERRRQQSREHKQRKAFGKVRQIGSTAHCEACGQPYTVSSGLQRYCPDCAPTLLRKHKNAASKAWNAAHTTPEERRAVRKESNAAIPCMVCGSMFVPVGPSRTCSPHCAEEAKRQAAKSWETRNREARNAYRRGLYAEKQAAMSEDERRAHRDEINARARENYKKRKERDV